MKIAKVILAGTLTIIGSAALHSNGCGRASASEGNDFSKHWLLFGPP
jgi:hypothetical protein